MMLRASVEMQGGEVDLNAVTRQGHDAGEFIEGSAELVAFAEAMVTGSAGDVARARATLVDRLGRDEFVRAAGVVGNFQRMVRIADATGIPLDGVVMALTDDIREDLGVNAFDGAAQSAELGAFGRIGGRVLRKLSKTILTLLPKVAPSAKRGSGEG